MNASSAALHSPGQAYRTGKAVSWFRKSIFSAEFAAPLVCVVFGLLISVMPHLVWWLRSGSPVWIADNDELLYLSYAGQAYFSHPAYLTDSALTAPAPAMYPWLQLVPGVLVARILSLGPLGISIVWRAWAGVSIALGWYLLARFYVRRPWPACALSAVLLADLGLIAAHPVVRQFMVAAQILLGRAQTLFDQNPRIHAEWRIITPGLSLAYLLLHIWLVARAREVPERKRILLAGISLGLLFYAYFFYWTAACFALAITFLLDQAGRKTYLYTGCVGLLLGLPAVFSTLLLKRSASPDWPVRTDLGIPVSRFSEFLIPKIALLLLAIVFAWVWKRRRDTIYVWALAFSAMVLSNHQILTAMKTQNEHWAYVWGPCLSFLLVFAAGDISFRLVREKQRILVAMLAFVFFHCAIGVWLRAVEAQKTRESAGFTLACIHYRDQLNSYPALPTSNAVVAGDKSFVELAAVLNDLRPLDHYAVTMSPWVSNSEWDARIALNGFLLGLDRNSFAANQQEILNHAEWGQEARNPAKRAERLAERLRDYDQVVADPDAALGKFKVSYVALGKTASTPPYLRGWLQIQNGPYWQLWKK